MQQQLDRALTITMVFCALLLTAIVVRREMRASAATPSREPVEIDNMRELASRGFVMGDPQASVTIVEFSDFQCPYCARLSTTLDSLLSTYPGRIRIVYRHFPIDVLHPQARKAAMAAECAGQQGRFHEFHDAMFADPKGIGEKPWEVHAEASGVADLDVFASCMGSEAVAERLREDSLAAESVGLTGTPTVIADGWLLHGTPSFGELEEIVLRKQD
jgi:protein-disulfide isomerase